MVGYQELEEGLKRHAFIGLIIPEDAIRISNYNGICRTNKAIIKSICILRAYDYVGRNSYRAVNYEYVSEAMCDIPDHDSYKIEVGDTLISDIDGNRFNGTKGIQFWIDKDVAIKQAFYMSEP